MSDQTQWWACKVKKVEPALGPDFHVGGQAFCFKAEVGGLVHVKVYNGGYAIRMLSQSEARLHLELQARLPKPEAERIEQRYQWEMTR